MRSTLSLVAGVLSIAAGCHYVGYWTIPFLSPSSKQPVDSWSCRPYLPNLFSDTPPVRHPAIDDATKSLNAYLVSRFSRGDIDSLSIAVVSSAGPLYEENFGLMRANETGSIPTHSHSIYRIASVAKLFNVLEGFILEQRGLISW